MRSKIIAGVLAALLLSGGLATMALPAAAADDDTSPVATEPVVQEETPAVEPEPETAPAEETTPVEKVAPPAESKPEPKLEAKPKPPQGHDPVTVCHKPGTPAQKELTFDDDGWKAHIKHGDTEGACPAPFEPYEESARWLLPDSWDYSTTPSYQAAIFPQDRFTGDEIPCGRWTQDDVYWIDSQADADLFASLGDVLTQGEDSTIYKSHVFTQGPECPVTPNPANPKAKIQASCGLADVHLKNPTNEGVNLTASFIVNVDGSFYGAYAVASEEVVDFQITFGEDTGDHLVQVYQAGTSEYKLIAEATVTSDCEPNIPPKPEPKDVSEARQSDVCTEPLDGTRTVTYEERYGQIEPVWDAEAWEWVFPPENAVYGEWTVVDTGVIDDAECAAVPPTTPPTTPPAPPADDTPSAQRLATTGGEFGPTIAWTLGSLAFAAVCLGVVLALRRRQVANEE